MAMKTTTDQLRLLDETTWALDTHTREIGRQGVAAARQLLRLAASSDRDDRTSSGRTAPSPDQHSHAA
jgi:hypothetical protein